VGVLEAVEEVSSRDDVVGVLAMLGPWDFSDLPELVGQ